MKKYLLTALIAFGVVLPAKATPTVEALFAAIRATGTSIVVDAPRICNKSKDMLGMYEYQKNVIDQLTICIHNHGGNSAEVFDTLLHESVHIAQACNGGYLFKPETIVKEALPKEILTVSNLYPNAQFSTELEARVIARQQDEVYVTELIKEHCK